MTHGFNKNVVYSVFRRKLLELAVFWKENVYPVPFDDVFILPGVRVHIVVERHESKDDTKPIGGAAEYEVMRSEQGIDL